MLLTRSIRRKLTFALLLILAMLMTLSISGASGLMAYAELIDEFQFSISDAPKHSELVRAIGQMFEPLKNGVSNDEEVVAFQRREFHEKLEAARAEIANYHRKLDDLSPTEAVLAWRPVILGFLGDIEDRLDKLETLEKGLVVKETRTATSRQILFDLIDLQSTAQKAPDRHDGLQSALGRANHVYHSRLIWIMGAAGVVVVLFGYLWWFSHTSVFAPLRKLHQGAQRVAQGDFDYRVDINTNDEVAELASSFNRMTARFQEITRDLDRQVRERSKQLVRSDRLAGIGLFAAGVAHEINNPLSAIATAAEALEYRQRDEDAKRSAAATNNNGQSADDQDSTLRTYLRIIQDEAFRCQTITRRILDFARPQEASRAPCDLANLVDEVLSLVGLMSKYRGRNIEFPKVKPCVIEINGPEIKQVVLNLVTNALESMDVGQTLHVSLTEQTDQVYVTLTDEGCGMTQEVIDNLFEPFFTRRKDGRGTGLGMSISNRIVADHGGRIEVSSDGPGKGSTFVVHLPRKAAPIAKAAA